MPIRLSVDDACASDVRVAELATKYGVECIFYWPVEWHSLALENGYEPLSFDDAQLIADGFEIGSHSVTHRLLTRIPIDRAKAEIYDSRLMLEALLDTEVIKFAPPRGYTNPALTEYTLLMYDEQRLTKDKNLVHIHPSSGVNDHRPWRELVTKDSEIWGHSWEIDQFNLWAELEEVMKEYA